MLIEHYEKTSQYIIDRLFDVYEIDKDEFLQYCADLKSCIAVGETLVPKLMELMEDENEDI